MDNSFLPSTSLRRWAGSIVQFVLLWALLLALVLSLFLLHGAWLWLRGVQYTAPSTFIRVWATDVSVDDQGTWAALLVTFRRNAGKDGVWSDIVLFDSQQRNAVCLDLRQHRPQCVAVNGQASAVAFGCADGSIYWVSGPLPAGATGRPEVKRLTAPACDTGLSRMEFSPDGKLLAAVGSHFVTVWRWPDGKFLRCRQHTGDTNTVLDFSADSQRILSLGESGELCYWDIETGDCVASVTAQRGHVLSAALVQQPRAVAFRTPSLLCVHSLDNGALLWSESVLSADNALDTEHRRLAIVGQHDQPGIVILDTATGQRRRSLGDHDAVIGGVRFARGNLLYSWDFAGEFRAWDVEQQKQVWSFSLLQWAGG